MTKEMDGQGLGWRYQCSVQMGGAAAFLLLCRIREKSRCLELAWMVIRRWIYWTDFPIGFPRSGTEFDGQWDGLA